MKSHWECRHLVQRHRDRISIWWEDKSERHKDQSRQYFKFTVSEFLSKFLHFFLLLFFWSVSWPPVFCFCSSLCASTLSPSFIKCRTELYFFTGQFAALCTDSETEVDKCFVCLMLAPLYPCISRFLPSTFRLLTFASADNQTENLSLHFVSPHTLNRWKCIRVSV